ncbi:MAG: LPS-assembly protein LptD [Ignavibacteriae bacterium]|nr:LPS-assembly protein LptD [Ignavibacteriota bacterium]
MIIIVTSTVTIPSNAAVRTKNKKNTYSALTKVTVDSLPQKQKNDSLSKPEISISKQPDSLNKPIDSLGIITDSLSPVSKSDLDTVVTYYAKDSVTFSLSKKTMRLRGQSKAVFKEQKLESEILIFDFNASTMTALSAKDSNGKFVGFPKFTDKNDEFVGEQLLFNFQTKRGTITLGETKVQDGFYFGSKVKRVNDNTLFIENGCYTTCSKPHPHYYFGSPKMKVITQDKIFLDPLILYVEDMPVFALPFGLYFENKSGRRSGIIIPTFFFSNTNGVTLQNMGYYFALSDYYDTQLTADIFTKTGFLIKNSSRYKYQNTLDGGFNLSFGRRRVNPDEPMDKSWSFDLNHRQKLTPQSSITASLTFSSQNFNRDYETDINKRITQNIFSNASLSQQFDNGSSLALSFSRSQNIITGEYQVRPNFSYQVPQILPFKNLVKSDNWISQVALTYGVNANYYLDKKQIATLRDSALKIYDTSFQRNEQYAIHHSPSLSISPKLGYFSITPQISYRENWFFRKVTKSVNQNDSSIENHYEHSVLPYRDYSWSTGVMVSTRLYGVVEPNLLGIKALRHVFVPSLSYSFTPEYSVRTTDKIGEYLDLRTGNKIQYSLFDTDGGEAPRDKRSQLLSFSFANTIQAKIAQMDTMPDLNVDLVAFEAGSGYDFEADSLKFKDIFLSFRTPALKFINFNGSSRFTLYDEGEHINPNGSSAGNVRINKYLISEGKGLARLTNFSVNLSTSFSSEGIQLTNPQPRDTTFSDSLNNTIGERFMRRYNYSAIQDDIYGENSPGFSPIGIPWSIQLGLTFSYNEPTKHIISRSLNAQAGIQFSITQTWKVSTNIYYDVVTNNFSASSVNVSKDLDCWDLQFVWYPTGLSQGFYLRFGIKSPQLHDLKIEKRDDPARR